MGVLRFKLLRDIWANKSRTLQVMLIIGIGSAAIGLIIGTRNLVVPGMQDIWQSMNPAMINLFIAPEISEDELAELRRVPGVAEIEGFNSVTIEWRASPQEEWRQGTLTARIDYRNQSMNRLELISGEWPHGREVANGQEHLTYGIPAEGVVYIRTNEREQAVRIGTGKIYDQLAAPATFGGQAQFYVDQEFYEYLVGNKNYGRALVKADRWDEDYVTQVADRLDAKIESMGKDSGRFITDPNKHFFQDQMDGIFFLMGVLGALSLVLGLLLVYNTINSIIASQTDQIGIMKAIGARTRQIVGLYLRLVLIYGVLALAVSLPLGILGAWGTSSWLVGSFGADLGDFELDGTAITIQVIICLLAPFLASLVPIWQAARITVREAVSTYGLSTHAGLLERVLTRLRFLSRLMIITVSNTFRHKWRVLLLQIALVLSGVVFMMVVSVRDAATYTFKDLLFTILNANITMVFNNAERIDYITDLTLQYPGVKAVEMWGFGSGKIRPRGQPASDDDEDVQLFGVPLPTQAYGYQLRGGRWLTPEDEYAIVLNAKQAKDIGENGVNVGDWVTVKYGEKNERNYQVVGLVFDPLLTSVALVERDRLMADLGFVGRSSVVWIQTEQGGLQVEQAIAKGLREYYEQNHVSVSSQRGIFGFGGESTTETGNAFVDQFNFLLVLLGIMAVVIGAVGSIALSGALSLSVLERRREIGVMRAIGASSWTIFRLFIGEGLILGWLSWLIAMPLAIPASQAMAQALGNAFQFELIYKYQPTGAIMWLAIITILSILASWLPANGATRVSVRESLAYQ
jgi:putative ABC transport system permease protein